MRFSNLIAIVFWIAAACGSPRPQSETTSCIESSYATTLTINATGTAGTFTTIFETTITTTLSSTPTSTSQSTTTDPITVPTSALTAISFRIGSPIHLLTMNAAGERLYLGGQTLSYCPSDVVKACPPGNETVFSLCSMVGSFFLITTISVP